MISRAGASRQKVIRQTLQYWSGALGCVCLADSAWEGLTAGQWHSYTGIYEIYYLLLAAYASTREVEKWTNPEARAETYWGEFFVGAWFVLAILMWAADAGGAAVCWPTQLTFTIKLVLFVFTGGKISKGIRDFKLAGLMGPEAGGGANPAPTQDDSGDTLDPTPGDGQDTPDDGGGASSGAAGKPDVLAIVRQACQDLGAFTAQQVVQKTGLSLDEVGGSIGWMIRLGLIRKLEDGRFMWIGEIAP